MNIPFEPANPTNNGLSVSCPWILKKNKFIDTPIPTPQTLSGKQLKFDLKTGLIATGDQFIHSNKKKDFLIREFDAKAVEMEGGSVNLVCNELNVPSLIMRSISDTADGDAPEHFNEFVEMVANRSANFVMSLIDAM